MSGDVTLWPKIWLANLDQNSAIRESLRAGQRLRVYGRGAALGSRGGGAERVPGISPAALDSLLIWCARALAASRILRQKIGGCWWKLIRQISKSPSA